MNQSIIRNDSESLSLPNLKILLVEDNFYTGELFSSLLTLYGAAEVITVPTADQALAVIQSSSPDILISSITWQNEDSYSLIKKIRNLKPEQGGNIPAIAITGSAHETNWIKLLNAGFDGYFSQPFSVEEFIEQVVTLAQSPLYSRSLPSTLYSEIE